MKEQVTDEFANEIEDIYHSIMDSVEKLPPYIAVHMLGVCLANIAKNTTDLQGNPVSLKSVMQAANRSAKLGFPIGIKHDNKQN